MRLHLSNADSNSIRAEKLAWTAIGRDEFLPERRTVQNPMDNAWPLRCLRQTGTIKQRSLSTAMEADTPALSFGRIDRVGWALDADPRNRWFVGTPAIIAPQSTICTPNVPKLMSRIKVPLNVHFGGFWNSAICS